MATTKYPFNSSLSSAGTITAEDGEAAQVAIGDAFGVATVSLGSASDTNLTRVAAAVLGLPGVQFADATVLAGVNNGARIGARDVSGNTELYVVFGSGAVVPLAREGLATPPVSDTLTLITGTTALAPLKYTAGTNLTTPVAGSREYDGKAHYASTAAGRGVLPMVQMIAPEADFTLLSQSGAQVAFPTGYDVLTVQGDTTYMFDGQYIINTGATTHTTGMSWTLASSATVTSFEYTVETWSAAANTTAASQVTHVSGVALKTGLAATSTAVYTILRFQGIARINAGGTIRPNIQFGSDPTGTNLMKVGSWVRFSPVGTGTVNAVGPWA